MRSATSGAATAIAAGVFGKVSTSWLECNEYSFELPRWTKKGYRIGFISDSHLTNDAAIGVTKAGVQYVISQKPDLIVFGGDFVEDTRDGSLGRMREAFSDIAGCGIPAVTVLGNHDYAAYDPWRVASTAHELGFTVLKNHGIELGDVTIFGLDCMSFGLERVENLVDISARKNVLVILHEPDGADILPDFPSLMLAGHSHGGQICLPMGIPITTPGGARKYKVGFYPDLRVPTFVSRGLGETGVRLRIFCRPEASILHLNPAGTA